MEGNRYKKGLWTVEEDRVLMEYIQAHGKGRWNRIAKMTGLKRCGKSCRLRWMNYLCPNIKHGKFSEEEDELIIRLHNLLGNRWSLIAGRVPGRTDNQVKNHWNSHLSKKMRAEEPKSNEMLSSLPLSKASEEVNLTCELPSNGATGGVCGPQMKGDHQMATMGCGSQELAMGEYDNGSSYWLFDDNLLYLNAPIWKELIDAYPLDVAWHEF